MSLYRRQDVISSPLPAPTLHIDKSRFKYEEIASVGQIPLDLWIHIFEFLAFEAPESSESDTMTDVLEQSIASSRTPPHWAYFASYHFILLSRHFLDCRDPRINRMWHSRCKEAFEDLFVHGGIMPNLTPWMANLSGAVRHFNPLMPTIQLSGVFPGYAADSTRSGRRPPVIPRVAFAPFDPSFHWYSIFYDFVTEFCLFRHSMLEVVSRSAYEERISFLEPMQQTGQGLQGGLGALRINVPPVERGALFVAEWVRDLNRLDYAIQRHFHDASLRTPLDLIHLWTVHNGQTLFSTTYQNYVFTSRLLSLREVCEELEDTTQEDDIVRHLVPQRHLLLFALNPFTEYKLYIDITQGYIYKRHQMNIFMVAFSLSDFFDILLDKRSKWHGMGIPGMQSLLDEEYVRRRRTKSQHQKRKMFDHLLLRRKVHT